MFERYTEQARRVIFFARYEASQFGSTTIETEHLLLGLTRQDKSLMNRFLANHPSIESIRKEIERRVTIREKVATSIDLPLTNECRRILAYADDEADRLNHRHIGSEHLLLGIMREEKCVAAEILHERGLRLSGIREELARSPVEAQTQSLSGSPDSQFASFEARAMANIVLRLLHRRFGEVPDALKVRVSGLPPEKIEALADSLLDFASLAEVEAWLVTNG